MIDFLNFLKHHQVEAIIMLFVVFIFAAELLKLLMAIVLLAVFVVIGFVLEHTEWCFILIMLLLMLLGSSK